MYAARPHTMRHLTSLKPTIGIGSLLGLGWVLVAFSTVRAIQSDASLYSRTVGVAISFALALALFAGAIGIVVYGLEAHAFRITAWTALGAATGMLAVVLNIVGIPLVRPDFTLALYMTVNAAAGGAVLGLLVGLYDAEQQRLRADLTEKRAEANGLSQRLSVINRVLRHDIRTQAQIIEGYTDRLEAGDLPADHAAEGIERANDRLTELSDEARQLQALLAGEHVDCETVDLAAVTHTAGDAVQSAHPELAVEYDLPDEQFVRAPPMLTQAIEHVLYNVVEHTESEPPRAEVSLRTAEGPPPVACLSITDHGPGIPEAEPASTGEREETPLDHSRGVGLWLVRWTVEEADGELTVETPANGAVGTVVTISLPIPDQ